MNDNIDNYSASNKNSFFKIQDFKVIRNIKHNNLREVINKTIKEVLNGNKTNLPGDDFNTGLILYSKDMHEYYFKTALRKFRKSKPGFLNPNIFPNSILNYITSGILREFKIRGLSNSLIYASIDDMITEFIESGLKRGILVNVVNEKYKLSRIKLEILFITKHYAHH